MSRSKTTPSAPAPLQAFGRPLTAIPRFGDARVALLLDADPLGFGPEQIRFARDIIAARQSHAPERSLRLYAVEPSWTLSGALADHRLALPHHLIRNVALAIAGALGTAGPQAALPADLAQFTRSATADLLAQLGAAMVLAGPRQPPEVHALCHWINEQLDAPIDYIAPVDPVAMGHAESLRNLAGDIHAGRIETLIVIGANPAYDTPGELGLADAIGAVPFSAHLGLYQDETAARCTWHLPLSHPLESWSDIRAFDGTASIVQPLIRPLYDSRTAHEILAMLGGAVAPSAFDLVREQWRATRNGASDFDAWWRQSLQDGVIADSASAKISAPSPALPQLAAATAKSGFSLALAPDPSVFDGSMANNAWLQECPKPFTKQVWGNVLHVSEADARNLGVVDGDVVRLTDDKLVVEAPVLVQPGQAVRTISTTLGYGRTHAGGIGNGVGFDIYRLRHADTPWIIENVTISRTGRKQDLLRTQHFFKLDGEDEDLQPRFNLADLAKGDLGLSRPGANPPTLYPPHAYDTYKWAMVIDTAACIGCNACVIACQAENNVPIVGPDEIAVGRDMHWLRIDDYVVDGRPGFSPVPCMHCEHAPCEPVCPVAASVHDGEGLNVQVYNRCVGTRFCQSNCPYKVRRFNFFGYADGEEYVELRRRHRQSRVQSRRHGARPRRHGEVHLLRPAHQSRAARRREGQPRDRRRRGRHRLPGGLSDTGDQLRRPLRSEIPRQCVARRAARLRAARKPRHAAAHHLSRPAAKSEPGFQQGAVMTAAIVMRDETPAAATRWTLPEARDFETVNALIAAPLLRARFLDVAGVVDRLRHKPGADDGIS